MLGSGIVKGLAVTLRHLLFSTGGALRRPAAGSANVTQTPLNSETTLFTVQYPEQRLKVPERFRYIPMLLYEQDSGKERCTSCGICAKVCPPQCIWIVRSSTPEGKPIPQPAEFFIDASICMSCGLCAEYCPFDAIKMNQNYELATPERRNTLLLRKKDLMEPVSYHAQLHPTDFSIEEAEKRAKEEADRVKDAAKAKAAAAALAAKPKPADAAATAPTDRPTAVSAEAPVVETSPGAAVATPTEPAPESQTPESDAPPTEPASQADKPE